MTVNYQDLTPKAVLDPGFLPKYERDIAAIHLQLAGLRTNLFVLEHLVSFPFGVLAPGQAMFWSVVIRNLYFSSLLAAWGLAFDTDSESLTISRFRNAVVPRIADPAVAKSTREKLATLNLEEVRDRLRPRLDTLRSKAIAHLDRALLSTTPGQAVRLPSVALSELSELCSTLTDVINALGFGVHYNTLPLDYEPSVEHPPGDDPRPDVERLLDDLARRSEYLNMPEANPRDWPYLCNALDDNDLASINRYRAKFGLPPCERPAT